MSDGVHIRPATPALLPEVRAFFGAGTARPSGCWCRRFLGSGDGGAQQALEAEIQHAETPVALAAVSGEDVLGWTRVMPRESIPGVVGNRALGRALPPDPRAWWITCVVVARPARGRGIGATLVRAAADWAADHGATVVDGHPVDVERMGKRPAPTALFTGTVSLFRAAGFTEIARTYPTRPVMRKTLATKR